MKDKVLKSFSLYENLRPPEISTKYFKTGHDIFKIDSISYISELEKYWDNWNKKKSIDKKQFHTLIDSKLFLFYGDNSFIEKVRANLVQVVFYSDNDEDEKRKFI